MEEFIEFQDEVEDLRECCKQCYQAVLNIMVDKCLDLERG